MTNCVNYITNTFAITLIPLIQSIENYSHYIFGFINVIYFATLFSNLYYPSYYISQPIIWTVDLALSFIVYNILYKLYQDTNLFLLDTHSRNITIQEQKEKPYTEPVEIATWEHGISFGFYLAYMGYWLYFAIFMFYSHPEPNVLIQLGNILMFGPWYLLFSTLSALYYFICVKLTMRSDSIIKFLKSAKKSHVTPDEFKTQYLSQYKKTKFFSKKFNTLIHIGLFLIIFHIPVDFITMIIKKEAYAIPGFAVKAGSLIWYIRSICKLNDCDELTSKYLCKHQMFDPDTTSQLNEYIKTRPLGIEYYGFKLNGPFLTQFVLFAINFVLPIVYGIFQNFKF